jgi:hypothetical protein
MAVLVFSTLSPQVNITPIKAIKQFRLQGIIAYHVYHYWYKFTRNNKPAGNGSFVTLTIALQIQAHV